MTKRSRLDAAANDDDDAHSANELDESMEVDPMIPSFSDNTGSPHRQRNILSPSSPPFSSPLIPKVLALASFTLLLLVGHNRLNNSDGAPPPPGFTASSTTNNNTSRRSFVCITGQANRLELANKIVAVLNPLRQAGYEPDIALILDDSSSTPHVTNDQVIKVDYTAHAPVFATFDDAVQLLRTMDVNVLTESPYIQVADPILSEKYVAQLHRKAGMSEEQHRKRAENNLRMMESWAQCHNIMVADIDRSMTYDLVVRTREDTGFLQALDVDFLVRQLHGEGDEDNHASVNKEQPKSERKRVVSNGCRYSQGMNDKFAILTRSAADTYFLSPFRSYYTKELHRKVMSSESFIYYTYLAEGLSILRPPGLRKIVKVVTDGEGNTKIYPGEFQKILDWCRVRIHDDSVPNSCLPSWDAKNRSITSPTDTCWRHKVKDPECLECI